MTIGMAVPAWRARWQWVPLTVLPLVLAVVIDAAAGASDRLVLGVAVVALAIGLWSQAPLYAQGNHYRADFERDRIRGCHVYGTAEWDRWLPCSARGIPLPPGAASGVPVVSSRGLGNGAVSCQKPSL